MSVGTEPPSIPVITGAAVAVGQNTQINVPCATSTLAGRMRKYSPKAPNICTASRHHWKRVTLNSRGETRQKVMNSIAKIRYGASTAILSMKL